MRYFLFLMMFAVQAWPSTLVVGPTRPYKTISAALGALLPLTGDVVIYVEMPSGNYASAHTIDAGSTDWNGFTVTIHGVFSLPDIVGYVDNELVYEFVGDKMDIHHENLIGMNGVETRVQDYRTKISLMDHLGSTRVTFDEAGAVDEASVYESFGKISPMVSGTSRTLEKYTGKEFDGDGTGPGGESGIDLDYFGARYYDPDLAMWISPDPAKQFNSPYATGGNPINSVDPDGRREFGVCEDGTLMGPRDWYIGDAKSFSNAAYFNLFNKGMAEYKTIEQRGLFYDWFAGKMPADGIKWPQAAADVVLGKIVILDRIPSMTKFGNSGNEAIFNDVFPALADAYQSMLSGPAARNWDSQQLKHEQHVIDPYYKMVSDHNMIHMMVGIFFSTGKVVNLWDLDSRVNFGESQMQAYIK